MSKRTYEEYIKNGCHPVGYNEPCQSYYFGQISVDLLLDKIDQLKQQLAEKDKEIERLNTIKNNAIECADLFKVALSVRQKDLAIQELEKIINIFEPYENDNRDTILKLNNNVSFIDYIEQRIKELGGK